MPDFSAPFVVEGSVRLPGLGLLVLPAAPISDWLIASDLHTALAVTFSASINSSHYIIGTIEEISRNDQPTQRALLLDFDPDTPLVPETRLQVSKASSEFALTAI
jgi:hypothetical protein